MSTIHHIVFNGEVAQGFEVTEVKEKLTSMLKESPETIDKLFSGKSHIIKRDPDLAKCEKIRDVLLSVGAVCRIEKFDNTEKSNANMPPAQNSAQKGPVISDQSSTKKSLNFNEIKETAAARIAQTFEVIQSILKIITERSLALWSEGVESIKSDLEVGGFKMVSKNSFFLTTTGISCVVVCLAIAAISYQRPAMPVTEKNFNQVLGHVEFIQKAFTPEELVRMRNNPNDFLDYMLVDPIEKMGYQFEASIDEITTLFLSNKLTSAKLRLASSYLEILARDRNSLHTSGIISEELKDKLEMVSNKMGI